MNEEEHWDAPIECNFCHQDNERNETGECEKCGKPFELEPNFCLGCNYPNDPRDSNCLYCEMQLPNMNVVLREKILGALKKNEIMSFGEISKKTGMTNRTSNLSYHLSKLSDDKLISKVKREGKNPLWKYEKFSVDIVESEILSFLSSDNYGIQSFTDIIQAMPDPEDTVSAAIERLSRSHQIETCKGKEAEEDVGQSYKIPFYQLPKDVCHHCRKKFQSNELMIGQIMTTDFDTTEIYPIHATCRPKLVAINALYDETESCCDYCGLELNHRDISLKLIESKDAPTASGELSNLQKAKNQQTIKNYESAIATLFDDPYSKIFSCINADYTALENDHNLEPIGYSHYVTNDGKKYHTYCAKQVEAKA